MRLHVPLFLLSPPVGLGSRDSFPLRRRVCSGPCHAPDPQSVVTSIKSAIDLPSSPLVPFVFRGRHFYIKRDDLLEHAGVKAGKLRKFYALFSDEQFTSADFVVSYGGAQSNAMVALAKLCAYRSKPFVYITRTAPKRLSLIPGNFKDAVDDGMVHVQIDDELFRSVFTDTPPAHIQKRITDVIKEHQFAFPTALPYFVPQGGAWSGAEHGVRLLAQELKSQIAELRAQKLLANKLPVIFMACGTGTTAFYLQKHLVDTAKVVAVPVSGSERYLIKQMRWLATYNSGNERRIEAVTFPDVLHPRLRGSFADVRPEKLQIWEELCRAADGEFEFDLIYAPKAWEETMMAIDEMRLGHGGEDIIYYHSGGLEGNASMLERFRRKGYLMKQQNERSAITGS